MRRLSAAIVVSGMLAGCQALLHLDSSASDASEPDASSDAVDADDAGEPADTGSDGGGGGFSCDARPDSVVFCDDFDDLSSSIDGKWSVTNESAGARVEPTVGHASPRAVRTSVPPVPNGTFGQANMRTAALHASGAKEILVRLSLRVTESGAAPPDALDAGYSNVLGLDFDEADCATRPASGSKERHASLVIVSSDVVLVIVGFKADCVADGGDFESKSIRDLLLAPDGLLPELVGEWLDLELVARDSPCLPAQDAGGSIVFRRGDRERCFTTGIDPTEKVGDLTLRIGPTVGQGRSAVTVDYDDVEIVVAR